MSEQFPGLIPVGAFTLEVLPEIPVLALEGEGTIRLTLAALDPENAEGDKPSTLRILRKVYPDDDDMISYSDDEDDEDDEDEEDEEEEKPKKKNAKKAVKDEEELEDADEDEDDDEDDYDDEDEEDFEISRTVICTLSPKTSYQQTIDIVINAEEDVIFEVSGSYPIHLTGNYVLHPFDEDSEDEDDYDEDDDVENDYDLSPDEDELDFTNRIQEVADNDSEDDEEEEEQVKPEPKQKNKKRANEEPPVVESKKQKKKADKAEDKKVAFSKELEQGPTGSTATKKGPTTKKLAGGVTVEDRKTGDGPTAQPGDKVSVRYIGKLLNGSTFDSNTKGKPFTFKLGAGEVIKGWDIGVAGMSVKGERRIVIPAASAYGKKALPGIPANSTLTFDVKLVSIK